mmetsp:Transcript_11089/g.13129  ORF Transcript_11089/g.13129 Transcript_11089/m.13129 type:complete len:514 (+) Transcript_11089:116-1657(+)|eukprot:CAMPEP_0198265668 /NCGR_PEP_ID=MMETSP1447-20131203/23956_1 /TAXON_ID=420782 /ORGANISM="Chaetoceros dichaeta, Strain CCMP1751" /LENGTH=513 /DNA_ID=CAMNT_0043955287 /DNA_START=75 /DNA_END=1616 /DNA_ORIENTATION=+
MSGETELELIESGEGDVGENSQDNDSERDEIANGSSLSSSSSDHGVNVNPTYYGDDDIDLIYDEDLSDVNKNVSLGNSNSGSDGDLSTEVVELEVCGDSSHSSYAKGYIDDEIVEDVMRNADQRLNADKPRWCTTKFIAYAVGVTSVLMIIIGLSLPMEKDTIEKIRIAEKIKDKGTAYDFDDRDEYAASIASETHGAEKAIQTSTIMEYKIPHDVNFPPWIEHYLVEPFKHPYSKDETPFFWQVPFAGDVFQSFMTACNKKVLASNHKMVNNNTMMIHTEENHKYVNVDLSTTRGIESAAQLGLPELGLAEVIVSNKLHLATTALLDAIHKGRLFTALRHPVDRSISEYYYSKLNDPQFKNFSLQKFVHSDHMKENWMTRSLVNNPKLPLVRDDLSLAKEILRQRCVVGLHENIELSFNLFERYFGWTAEAEITENVRGYSAKDLKDAVDAHDTCKRDVLKKEQSYAFDIHKLVGDIDEELYSKIVEKNKFDMELFWYANYLFEEQQRLVTI